MYYYTTFQVTLSTWTKGGKLVATDYSAMTFHPDTQTMTVSFAPDTANPQSYPDIGILAGYEGASGTYEVLSDLFYMDPKIGGDSSQWGSPGATPVKVIGPLYMADVSSNVTEDSVMHALVLEFEYIPTVKDGYRHTALIYLQGEPFWEYGYEISSINPVDFSAGSVDFEAWLMQSIIDNGGIEEPDATGINWMGDWQHDYPTGTGESDTMNGAGGNDWIEGLAGHDLLIGGTGRDTLFAGDGDDTLHGGEDNDWLVGAKGNDRMFGNAGDDSITGWDGSDFARGGSGNDTISCGAGNDTVFGDVGDDVIYLEAGKNRASGGAGNDTIYGGTGQDRIKGQGGNDSMTGDTGHDTLSGAGGNDTLGGGAGNDRLRGGSGSDVFIYTQGRDVIYDLSKQDRLVLDTDLFSATVPTKAADLEAYAYQNGDTLVLDFGEGDTLAIRHMTLKGLSNVTFEDML